jgi:prepilin peptidase CpaA
MLLLAVTLVLLLIALYLDLRYQRIPNKLCLFALLFALLLQGISGQWQGLEQALLGAGLALLLLLPLYGVRWLAAGDVKLMVAVGALSGPSLLLWSVAYGIIFGIFTSLLLALYKVGWSGIIALMTRRFIKSKNKGRNGEQSTPMLQVPYAPALALGWLIACYLDPNIALLVTTFTA